MEFEEEPIYVQMIMISKGLLFLQYLCYICFSALKCIDTI